MIDLSTQNYQKTITQVQVNMINMVSFTEAAKWIQAIIALNHQLSAMESELNTLEDLKHLDLDRIELHLILVM